jgi:hypothetical protein
MAPSCHCRYNSNGSRSLLLQYYLILMLFSIHWQTFFGQRKSTKLPICWWQRQNTSLIQEQISKCLRYVVWLFERSGQLRLRNKFSEWWKVAIFQEVQHQNSVCTTYLPIWAVSSPLQFPTLTIWRQYLGRIINDLKPNFSWVSFLKLQRYQCRTVMHTTMKTAQCDSIFIPCAPQA